QGRVFGQGPSETFSTGLGLTARRPARFLLASDWIFKGRSSVTVPTSRVRAILGVVLSLCLAVPLLAEDGNWPQWRGRTADGHSADQALPVRWDVSSVVWKI